MYIRLKAQAQKEDLFDFVHYMLYWLFPHCAVIYNPVFLFSHFLLSFSINVTTGLWFVIFLVNIQFEGLVTAVILPSGSFCSVLICVWPLLQQRVGSKLHFLRLADCVINLGVITADVITAASSDNYRDASHRLMFVRGSRNNLVLIYQSSRSN